MSNGGYNPRGNGDRRQLWSPVGLPHQGRRILWGAIVLSALLHWLTYVPLGSYLGSRYVPQPRLDAKEPLRIKIIPPPTKADDPMEDEEQRIVEAPLEPTAPPEQSKYLGAQDHQTAHETRVRQDVTQAYRADAGVAGTGHDSQRSRSVGSSRSDPRSQQDLAERESPSGDVAVLQSQTRRRTQYESVLPQPQELLGQIRAGYQDYIDENLDYAEAIDLNTTDYRYIGYVTLMRKAIYQVWLYPSEAVRRGMQGEGVIYFRIMPDGTVTGVKIVKSSGYDVLDRAVTEAVRLAQPFPPIPGNVQKEHLPMRWGFRYVLSTFAAGH